MRNLMKRGIALLLVLFVFVASVPALGIDSSAAGGYIYNWGERGEVATSLSSNAEAFYKANNTSYKQLAALSGSTDRNSVPSSALYRELKDLMTSAHDYQTSYAATKELYRYTDCENGGGSISSFYSGTSIGPGWGEGGSWNREHTWPDSKGLGGNDENDIMMLRPTASSENSSRGNTAYGKSASYYNPNSESGGKYDLRGDVARIFLYVYVRWGNTSYAWGTSGVMESKEVLLEWMEADPVDTWELGRNDAVESITGTRNVFVDYPELCFILFGEQIPGDMTTPSGSGSCDHNNFDQGVTVPATCTTDGYTIYTCQTSGCGNSYVTDTVAATGHSYTDGICTKCGEAAKAAPTVLTKLNNGDVVVIGAPKYSMALSSVKVSTYYNQGVEYSDGFDVITDAELFTVTVNSDGSYTFTSKTGDVLALAAEHNSLNAAGENKSWTLEAKSGATGVFYVKNVGRGTYLEWYATKNNWSTYTPDTLSDLFEISFYSFEEGGNSGTDTPGGDNPGGDNPGGDTPDTPCTHSYTEVVIAPTCTSGGFSVFTCALCGDEYTGNNTSAKGHSYSNGECTVCGAEKPSATQVTITFDDKNNRIQFSESTQVWQQNGITVTNNKANATSSVADYIDPIRCYQNSEVIIEYPGIIKLEIDCSGLESKYVESWMGNAPTGAITSNNNGIITVEFSSPVDSVTYTQLAKQSRAYSITVYTAGGSGTATPTCEHKNYTFEGAVDATCTSAGHTGKIRCNDCGEIISNGETIDMIGHSWVAADCDTPKTCSVCGATSGSALGHDWSLEGDTTSCDRCGANGFDGSDGNEGGETEENDHSSCVMEVDFFTSLINAIVNFFRTLFGMQKQCVCGKLYD